MDCRILVESFLVSAALALAVPAQAQAGAKASAASDPVTQGIMHSLLEPISQILPLSFDDQVFKAPENREKIAALFKQLRDNVGVLEQHAHGKERAFEFVAKSLQNDAKHAYRWYTSGAYDEARFTLHNMTENCITCHATLPEGHKFPPAEHFFKAVKVESLHPLERAHYYVMSRQFDDALGVYESFFLQGDVPPSALTTLGSFIDYLKICANVKQDLQRPRKLLEAVLRRPGVTPVIRDGLVHWERALADLDAQGALAKTSLKDARAIVDAGRAEMEFPRDREGLMHYLVASAILSRYVHSHPDHGADVAEAYYMLGITESLLGHSFWVSRSEFYLESAIRLAPSADFSPKAYAMLEESYTTNFSGSAGTHVPDDVKELLGELKRVIEEARGTPKKA